jgi:uncharacterized membrane protein
LGLLQQNQKNQESRKQEMEAAALGNLAPPAAQQNDSLGPIVNAVGGMLEKKSAEPEAASATPQLSKKTAVVLDDALASYDKLHPESAPDEDDNMLPIRGGL